MEWGTALGLSAPLGSEARIQDQRYQNALMMQARDKEAAKSAMLADDAAYSNPGITEFDRNAIEAYSRAKIAEVGKFVNSNPDWNTNWEKRAQYKQLIHDLKDNEHLTRAMATKAAYGRYMTDLATKQKDPTTFNEEEYRKIANDYNNLNKYGHVGGAEGFAKEGAQSFLYVQPQDKVDLAKFYNSAGQQYKDRDRSVDPNGYDLNYKEIVRPETFNPYVGEKYAQVKAQTDKEAQLHGFKTGEEYAYYLTHSGVDLKQDYGDPRIALARQQEARMNRADAKAEKPQYDFAQNDIFATPNSRVNVKALEGMLGKDGGMTIVDNYGKPIVINGERHFDGTKYVAPDYDANGNVIETKSLNNKRTIKHIHAAQGEMYLSLSEAAQYGMVNDDGDILPQWKGRVSIGNPDSKGNPTFKARGHVNIYDTQSNRYAYNKAMELPNAEIDKNSTKFVTWQDENGSMHSGNLTPQQIQELQSR